jgi:hypothetical protein
MNWSYIETRAQFPQSRVCAFDASRASLSLLYALAQKQKSVARSFDEARRRRRRETLSLTRERPLSLSLLLSEGGRDTTIAKREIKYANDDDDDDPAYKAEKKTQTHTTTPPHATAKKRAARAILPTMMMRRPFRKYVGHI